MSDPHHGAENADLWSIGAAIAVTIADAIYHHPLFTIGKVVALGLSFYFTWRNKKKFVPYIYGFERSDWGNNNKCFFLELRSNVHGKGKQPIAKIQILNESGLLADIHPDTNIDQSGNLLFYSHKPFKGRVLVQ